MSLWNSTKQLVRYSFKETPKWLKSLRQHGVVLLGNTVADPNLENLNFYQSLANDLDTKIYKSMYGDIWDTAGDFGDPTTDLAYSNLYLPPHTDLNYVQDTPKYQVFTSIIESETGGETLIVDARNVKDMFRKHYPSAYDSLKAEEFLFTCSEKKHSFRHKIFDSEEGVIHHNDGDMEKVDMTEYHMWNDMTLDPFFKVEIKLNPGDTIVIDNHRCLHGRNSFTGRRNLKGCYLK